MGALHGVYLMVNHGWRALVEAMGLGILSTNVRRAGSLLAWLLTLLATIVAFVTFRANSLANFQACAWRYDRSLMELEGIPAHTNCCFVWDWD